MLPDMPPCLGEPAASRICEARNKSPRSAAASSAILTSTPLTNILPETVFRTLVVSLYDAALGETSWAAFLAALGEALPAAKTVLFSQRLDLERRTPGAHGHV